MKSRCAHALGLVSLLVGCNDGSSPTMPQPTSTTSITTTTTTAPPTAELVVEKRAVDVLENTLNTIHVNTDFFYYIEVSNQGTADALGVQIIDVIPETLDIGFLEFTERSGYDCGRLSRTVECTLARLTPGSTFKLYVEVKSTVAHVRLENVAVVNPDGITATAVVNVQ
jgi:uncharacterized repeat protein (TIGR01451 family)